MCFSDDCKRVLEVTVPQMYLTYRYLNNKTLHPYPTQSFFLGSNTTGLWTRFELLNFHWLSPPSTTGYTVKQKDQN